VKSNEILSFFLFISGYMLGRIDYIIGFFKKDKKLDSFVDKIRQEENQERLKKKFSIDDSKFVTKVSTETFQKSGELGVNSESSDDITSETAKLVKFKKKKG